MACLTPYGLKYRMRIEEVGSLRLNDYQHLKRAKSLGLLRSKSLMEYRESLIFSKEHLYQHCHGLILLILFCS
jgi:hypothetical protein